MKLYKCPYCSNNKFIITRIEKELVNIYDDNGTMTNEFIKSVDDFGNYTINCSKCHVVVDEGRLILSNRDLEQ